MRKTTYALSLLALAALLYGAIHAVATADPYAKGTTASLNVGATETVTTTIDGLSAVWIRITPSKNPGPGTPHKVFINDDTHGMEMDSAAPPWEWSVTIGRSIDHLPATIKIESGKAATTFDWEFSIL